jgi:capsule biosynthesis phosphatase
MKRIVLDLDHTICVAQEHSDGDIHLKYENAKPIHEVISKIREYKELGFQISIYTSRNMRSYNGNLELIRQNTLPRIVQWLERHNIAFDEVIIGKPWCGKAGFYVDDRSVRPSEFSKLQHDQIVDLLSEESRCNVL